ncbi:hypothetical protein KJZ63_00950 [Patescibacteria group bacterium]|nr:hypothetical protein [Patescibacteria group bacterium]
MKKSNSSKLVRLKKWTTTLAVFISRFGFLPANFSPLGSFGFFGQNFWLYFGSIVLFDLAVGGFYKGFIFTYLGFGAYYLLGKLAKNNPTKQALYLPIASFAFFALSNFGSWYFWYPHNLEGFLACYILALPFYRNTLIADFVFGYGYLYLKKRAEAKKTTLKTWDLGEASEIRLGKNQLSKV